MTPDEARRAIHDAEDLRASLPADCWRALEAVAGMREEWGVSLPDGQLAGWGTYDTALEDMNAWRRDGYDARIVRRYVTEPEEA